MMKMKVKIRHKLFGQDGAKHSEPWPVPQIGMENLPRKDEQFTLLARGMADPVVRTFQVTMIEWHYDDKEIHIIATEYPLDPPPPDIAGTE
jgi:hypothetical protein